MRTSCVESRLRYLFFEYGKVVARHPHYFIIVPLIFAAGMGGGFAMMVHEENVIYLYTPTHSVARGDQEYLTEAYSAHKGFDPIRSLDLDIDARIIITHKENGSVWNKNSLDELYKLDDFMKKIKTDGITYESLCARNLHKQCYEDEGLAEILSSNNLTGIQYPMHNKPTGRGKPARKIFMGFLLGGVTTDDSGYVTDVVALQLIYYLQNTSEVRPWLKELEKQIVRQTFRHIKIDFSHSYFFEQELIKSTEEIIPYYIPVFLVLSIFSIASTMLLDPVRSKPLLGLCGAISAGLAIMSAGGLLMYCGFPYTDLVAAAPFLALGIGVDNMFVMLAAWRKTDHYLDMTQRLAEALSLSAMSITITSATDIMAVGIGLITPFPSVKLFSIYTCLMLTFTYIFQITFFAACMAVSGFREETNRHAFTCLKVMAKSEAGMRSDCYMNWCAGGVSHTDPNYEVDRTEVPMMIWFRDKFSVCVTHPFCKGIVLFLTAVYLGVAIWGCILVTHGIELNSLLPEDSHSARFYNEHKLYFGEYSHHVQLTVIFPLDKQEAFDQVKKLVKTMEDSEHFRGEQYTLSWLRDYEDYANKSGIYIDYGNFFDKNFAQFLKEEAYKEYALDALWQVDTFRFILTPSPTTRNKEERVQMKEGRSLVYQSTDIRAVVYSPQYILVEQYVEIFTNTLASLQISICTVLGMSILLIPSPYVPIWMALSIGSILFGVTGYMGHWGVNLDPVSLTQLIICVGFSVDYTTHITYAFVDSKRSGRDERAEDALYSIGLPILQGAVSTLISIAPLSTSETYTYTAFCKIIFFGIIFAAAHGLLVLPVLLSLFGPKGSRPARVNSLTDVMF